MNVQHPEHDGTGAPPSRPKRGLLGRAVKIIGRVVLGVVLVVLLLVAALQTEPVRRMLVGALADGLAAETGWRLEVGSLEGLWPFRLWLADIRLSDSRGAWLTVAQARITLLPWPSSSGLPSLDARLKQVEVSRAPLAPAGPPPKPSRPLAFLDQLGVIPVPFAASLEADAVCLGEALAGRALTARTSVEVRNTPSALEARVVCERIEGPSARVEFRARFEAQARSARIRLGIEEPPGGMVAEMAGLAGETSLSVLLDGAGPLADWRARLTASRAGENFLDATLTAGLGRSSAEDARFSLDATVDPQAWLLPEAARSGLGREARLTFKGTLTSAGLPDPQWKFLVEDLTARAAAGTASLRGDTGSDGLSPRMHFTAALSNPAALGLAMGPITAEGSLEADIDPSGPLTARASLEVPDVAGTLKPLRVGLQGAIRLKAALTGDTVKRNWSMDLDGGVFDIAGSDGRWGNIAQALGREATLQAKVRLDSGNNLALDQSRIAAGTLSAQASGTLGLDSGDVDLGLALDVADLAPLSPLAGKRLAGTLTARSKVQGRTTAPRITLNLDGRRLAFAATRFDQAGLEAEASIAPEASNGRVAASASRGSGILKLDTRFALAKDRLTLPGLRLAGPGLDASGDLDLNLEAPSASGKLKAGLDLARLGAFLNERMSGTVRLAAALAAPGGRQDVSVSATASGVSGVGVELRRAELSGSATDVLRSPQGKLTASVSGAKSGRSTLESLSLTASGTGKEAAFSVAAKGALPEPFEARTSGAFAPAPGGGRLRLEALRANAYGAHLTLERPATVTFVPDGVTFQNLALALEQGRITASGDWKQSRVDLVADVERFPLDLVGRLAGQDISGAASAKLRLSGASRNPTATARVTLDQVRLGGQARNTPLLQVTADAECSGGRLAAHARLSAGEGVSLEAKASIPARLSLQPAAFSLPPGGEMQAGLQGSADLATFAAFTGQEGLILRGILKADLTGTGRLDAPQVSGRIGIENGDVEYVATGTVLRGVTLRVEAQGSRIAIQELSATDGASGTVSGRGRVDVSPEGKFPLTMNITLNKAALLRMDTVAATVSGNVSVSGDASAMKASGKLSCDRVEVNIPDRLPPDAVPVKVQMVNAPPSIQAEARKASGPAAPVPLAMDVDVDFPGRIFVRGMGVDSVWDGKLHVGGTATAPAVAGDISVVRGRVDFFGKQFNLVKGLVSFTGNTPPMPRLDVDAQATGGDITADILVTGDADRPKVSFSSSPPLPQDEILSRVLFGKSVSGLNAPQALQLAQAAAAFAGKGDALDILGRTRKLVGLDYLGLGTTTGGQGSLVAGKYITDKIYVETGQGLGGKSGTVSVQVDVMPHLTLDSTVGTDSKTGVGLSWKLDY